MSKKEVLWEAVDHHKPDFIIGCETWLKPTITDNEVLPIGYKIHDKDRANGYGGVLIGIKITLHLNLYPLTPPVKSVLSELRYLLVTMIL